MAASKIRLMCGKNQHKINKNFTFCEISVRRGFIMKEVKYMMRIAIVGCTGKLGSAIMKNALNRKDIEVSYAIARKGNRFVGHAITELVGGESDLPIIDDIEVAKDCDIFIDCTNAETFMNDSYFKYEKMGKSLVIATTAFSNEDMEKISKL